MKHKKQTRIFGALLLLGILLAFPAQVMADSSGTGTTTIGFTAGTLTLSEVPSFDFGTTNVIPTTATTYTASTVTGKILVIDNRGSGVGWKLSAKMGAFSNVGYTGSDPIMPTSELQLPAPGVAAYSGNTSTAPATLSVANLKPAEASGHTIITAAVNQGNGGWQGTYLAAGVKLVVQADNVVAGTNTATITWTLADAP